MGCSPHSPSGSVRRPLRSPCARTVQRLAAPAVCRPAVRSPYRGVRRADGHVLRRRVERRRQHGDGAEGPVHQLEGVKVAHGGASGRRPAGPRVGAMSGGVRALARALGSGSTARGGHRRTGLVLADPLRRRPLRRRPLRRRPRSVHAASTMTSYITCQINHVIIVSMTSSAMAAAAWLARRYAGGGPPRRPRPAGPDDDGRGDTADAWPLTRGKRSVGLAR